MWRCYVNTYKESEKDFKIRAKSWEKQIHVSHLLMHFIQKNIKILLNVLFSMATHYMEDQSQTLKSRAQMEKTVKYNSKHFSWKTKQNFISLIHEISFKKKKSILPRSRVNKNLLWMSDLMHRKYILGLGLLLTIKKQKLKSFTVVLSIIMGSLEQN